LATGKNFGILAVLLEQGKRFRQPRGSEVLHGLSIFDIRCRHH
jgi:hypothetical protein